MADPVHELIFSVITVPWLELISKIQLVVYYQCYVLIG